MKLSVLFLIALAACGGKKSAGGTNEAIAKLTDFKAKLCACKDPGCALPVLVEYQKWGETFAASKKGQDKMSDDQEKQIDALQAEIQKCGDKAVPDEKPPVGSAAPDKAAAPPAGHASNNEVAQLQLNKLGKNSKVYFITSAAFVKGKAAMLPAGDCCAGPDKKCAPEKDAFEKDPVWKELDFSIDEPSAWSYEYESDGATFTATAVGDPDCSGKKLTYKIEGTSENGNAAYKITGP